MDTDERRKLRLGDADLTWMLRLFHIISTDSEYDGIPINDWISSFRGGEKCERLPVGMRGAYNVGYVFRFFCDQTKWFARFPRAACVMEADAKLLREVATMRWVQKNTTIPIPAVHAYGTAAENPLGLGAFIVMDFVEGIRLDLVWGHGNGDDYAIHDNIAEQDLRRVYRQVSGYLLELQDKPFEKIGSLALRLDGSIAADVSPLTRRMQAIEQDGGPRVAPADSVTFSSTLDYFRYTAQQTASQLYGQANSVWDTVDARTKHINQQRLEAIIPAFVDRRHDRAPFRLRCDDFGMHNILVRSSDDLEIVAVLDWEWSYAGPYQLFASPPRWLVGTIEDFFNEKELARYVHRLDIFLDEMKNLEDERNETPTTTPLRELLLSDPLVSHQNHVTTEWLPVRVETPSPYCPLHLSNATIGASPHPSSDGPTLSSPPGAERLSTLMRNCFEDGRFWIHELLLSEYNGADKLPWRKLLEMYPWIGDVDFDEAEVRAFVTRKIPELRAYEEELALMKAERARQKEANDKKKQAKDAKVQANGNETQVNGNAKPARENKAQVDGSTEPASDKETQANHKTQPTGDNDTQADNNDTQVNDNDPQANDTTQPTNDNETRTNDDTKPASDGTEQASVNETHTTDGMKQARDDTTQVRNSETQTDDNTRLASDNETQADDEPKQADNDTKPVSDNETQADDNTKQAVDSTAQTSDSDSYTQASDNNTQASDKETQSSDGTTSDSISNAQVGDSITQVNDSNTQAGDEETLAGDNKAGDSKAQAREYTAEESRPEEEKPGTV